MAMGTREEWEKQEESVNCTHRVGIGSGSVLPDAETSCWRHEEFLHRELEVMLAKQDNHFTHLYDGLPWLS